MDNVDHIVVEQLKALRSELASMRTRIEGEFSDVKARLNHMEETMVGMRRDMAEVAGEKLRQQVSIDALAQRVDRIERRLELTP